MRNEADPLPVYVINLDRRHDRWRIQRWQGRIHRLNQHRVSAKEGAIARQRFPTSDLSDGALGLWATFDELIARLAAEKVDRAIVLEDDAILLPGFRRRVASMAALSTSEIAVLQLGFLNDSSWRPNNPLWANVRKILRPRSRVRQLIAQFTRKEQQEHLTMRAGTHALLVFPSRLATHLPQLMPTSPDGLPLDNAFVRASRENPRAFTRVSRSMAFQLPVASDISWKRTSDS